MGWRWAFRAPFYERVRSWTYYCARLSASPWKTKRLCIATTESFLSNADHFTLRLFLQTKSVINQKNDPSTYLGIKKTKEFERVSPLQFYGTSGRLVYRQQGSGRGPVIPRGQLP